MKITDLDTLSGFHLDNASIYVYHNPMRDLFSIIPLRMQDISGGYMQSQIQIHEKDLFTGIFHLSQEKTEHVLLFLQGKLILLYRLGERSWETQPARVWNEIISSSHGDLRVLPLPVESLYIFRILLESDFREEDASKELPANELMAFFATLPLGGKNMLSVIRQGEFVVVLLIASENASLAEGAMYSSHPEVQAGPGILHRVMAWGNRICQLNTTGYNPTSDSWKEFALRNSFSDFVKQLVSRYEELAGRFLVSDINEQVNEECATHMWVISMQGHAFSSRHFFDTIQNAARAYTTLLEIMEKQMQMVIGMKMTRQILLEALNHLPVEASQLLSEQVFARTQPGGRAVKAGG